MRTDEAINFIKNSLKTLGYKSVEESLHTNNYGKEVVIECVDLDRMNNIITELLNNKTYQEIAPRYKISYQRVTDIVNNYIRCLKSEKEIQNTMLENLVNESIINEDLNEEEFIKNYKKVLKGEYPDKYYLYLPAESLDIKLTNTYSKNLYSLLTDRKFYLRDKIHDEPLKLFNRMKEMYNKMDNSDKDILESLPIIIDLKVSAKNPNLKLSNKSYEEELLDINQRIEKLTKKKEKILKKLNKDNI